MHTHGTDFVAGILDWGRSGFRSFPWRDPDATPYEILVAELFLKQTRASTVSDVFPGFIERFPSFEAIGEASRDELVDEIRPLGLYNHRADALMGMATELEGSNVPQAMEELLELPQVGPYIASAVQCLAFDEPTTMIDTNVRRIYSRLFLGAGEQLGEGDLANIAEELLPEGKARRYNLALLDFGAAVCTEQSPSCSRCFASRYCNYYQDVGPAADG